MMTVDLNKTEPSRSPVWNIILLGPQGSGKGTQAKLLVEKFGLRHLELGKLLRAAAEQDTEEGRAIDRVINQEGKLAPFDLAMGIFKNELKAIPNSQSVIFDGTPRRLEEVAYWDQELPRLDRAFTHLIALTLPKEATIERLSRRRVCSVDGTPFIFGVDIMDDSAPCPKCGGQIIWRTDDTPPLIEQRLQLYHDLTAPVIDAYRMRGIVHEVNGNQSISDVFKDIVEVFRA